MPTPSNVPVPRWKYTCTPLTVTTVNRFVHLTDTDARFERYSHGRTRHGHPNRLATVPQMFRQPILRAVMPPAGCKIGDLNRDFGAPAGTNRVWVSGWSGPNSGLSSSPACYVLIHRPDGNPGAPVTFFACHKWRRSCAAMRANPDPSGMRSQAAAGERTRARARSTPFAWRKRSMYCTW
jgi:hypothetical protein